MVGHDVGLRYSVYPSVEFKVDALFTLILVYVIFVVEAVGDVRRMNVDVLRSAERGAKVEVFVCQR